MLHWVRAVSPTFSNGASAPIFSPVSETEEASESPLGGELGVGRRIYYSEAGARCLGYPQRTIPYILHKEEDFLKPGPSGSAAADGGVVRKGPK